MTTGTNQPGTLVADASDPPNYTCEPTSSPPGGTSCGTDYYYSTAAGMCVQNSASCDSGNGTYQSGTCAPTPSQPTTPTPTGFTPLDTAGANPPGDQQPMCVNASPFIGGGVFVVSGTVLCYTGAGKSTDMSAYTDPDTGTGGGWNPFDPQAWNSLRLRDLYAEDDITALGTLSVYEGAQIYSQNGNNGVQVDNDGVLVRAADDDGNVASLELTPKLMTMLTKDDDGNQTSLQLEAKKATLLAKDDDGNSTSAEVTASGMTIVASDGDDAEGQVKVTQQVASLFATDGTSSSTIAADSKNGASMTAFVEGTGSFDKPAVQINGAIGASSDALTGVEISGNGKGGNGAVDGKGEANWADVIIHSANYGTNLGETQGIGTAVIVNDYGVQIKAPELKSGGASYNEFGSGAGNEANSSLINNIGEGGDGTVSNFLGSVGSSSSIVYNAIGTDPNSHGGASVNTIGNANAKTEVAMTAGTSSMTMIQGALDMGSTGGSSTLPGASGPVSGGNSVIHQGGEGRHIVVDDKGQMQVVDGVASSAVNSVYLTNGNGVTNGMAVGESGTTISGGEAGGTSLTFSDTGAHYANVVDGSPVHVSGVADGSGPYEAANIRQLDSGLASAAALAALPAPQLGKANSFGFAFGTHKSGRAMAMGGQSVLTDALTLKYGLSVSESSGLYDSTASVGVGWSW